jgi:hypothetical protein
MNKIFLLLIFVLLYSCPEKNNEIRANNKYTINYINEYLNTYDIFYDLKFAIELTNALEEFRTNKNKLRIKCLIENISDYPVEIYLKDHHDYHGTLNYPTSFYIIVKNEYGEILAQEFSSYFFWSTFFPEEPGDRVILNPKEKIVRIIKLTDIHGYSFIKEMTNGKYYVNIVLAYSDRNLEHQKKYISNTLEINILN